jgi:hypothetical protein
MSGYKTSYRMALALAIISLLAAAPMYLSMAPPALSGMFGCPKPSGESIIHCVVLGMDWGAALTVMAFGVFFMGISTLVGALFFGLWLVVWLSTRLAPRRAEIETATLTDAARIKLWMMRILAGITSLANLPWYFAFAIPFLLRPERDSALHAIQQSLVATGMFLASVAAKALIGWVFLALALWLSYPRNRASREAA